MSSRLPAGLFALIAALLTVVLSGCGAGTATIDPVAQAADATTHAGGAQISMHIAMELEGLRTPFTLTGTGDLNFAAREGELISDLSGLPTSAVSALHAGSVRFTELFTKGSLYLESPLLAGKLPGGARWMKLDLAKVAQGAGLDPQSLTSGQSNPAQVLDYLKASGGSVTKLGTEQVRGTETTRYRGSIDLAKVAGKLPKANRAQLKSAIEKLVSQTGQGTIPVEVWVDSHNLVRRISMTLAEAPEGHHVKMALELELFNFGATPSVNPPASSEVFNATQTSLSALSSAGG